MIPFFSLFTAITSFTDIAKTISYINRGVELNQPRLIQRAIRQNVNVRRYVSSEQLGKIVELFVPSGGDDACPTHSLMLQLIAKLPVTQESVEMEVSVSSSSAFAAASSSTSSSITSSSSSIKLTSSPSSPSSPTIKGTSSLPSSPKSPKSAPLPPIIPTTPPTSIFPEVEVYILTLIVTTLLRCNLDIDAAFGSTALVERIRMLNRRSLDLLSSKAFFYYSLAHERVQRLEHIRPMLLALFRTACIRHDDMGVAVLLNLLLRNYLHYNLIEQAQTLSLRTSFPENASNNQFCRYLYYMGRIQTIQLEYGDAYQRLMMALRKSPQESAKGFTIVVQKLAIIVQLLMGESPERAVFNQPEFRGALGPYLALTHAVRNGDLQQFQTVMNIHRAAFQADKNLSLVQRLGHNVVKTGLRKLSIAYSHISLADVATKLRLPSVAAAEHICAKAIRDGVIDATINHDAGTLTSVDQSDLYATQEPQKAFHRRIAFCLDVHNEAVKSMRYPPDVYRKEKKTAAAPADEEKTIEEIIKEMEEDDE